MARGKIRLVVVTKRGEAGNNLPPAGVVPAALLLTAGNPLQARAQCGATCPHARVTLKAETLKSDSARTNAFTAV